MSKKSIQELLKEARDIDKDIKIMAANDLCGILLDGPAGDLKLQKDICEVYMNHLDSDAIDVQGTAY